MVRAAVSGSFHRHMTHIYAAVGELRAAGVDVLSPSDPRIVDHIGEFLFVASDKLRSVRLVQDRHLHCIRAASFLWLVTPDGYVGPSASMEVGYAAAVGTPVMSDTLPHDITLREYVTKVPGIGVAVELTKRQHRSAATPSILIDPVATIESAHRKLDALAPLLQGEHPEHPREAERAYDAARLFFLESLNAR